MILVASVANAAVQTATDPVLEPVTSASLASMVVSRRSLRSTATWTVGADATCVTPRASVARLAKRQGEERWPNDVVESTCNCSMLRRSPSRSASTRLIVFGIRTDRALHVEHSLQREPSPMPCAVRWAFLAYGYPSRSARTGGTSTTAPSTGLDSCSHVCMLIPSCWFEPRNLLHGTPFTIMRTRAVLSWCCLFLSETWRQGLSAR